MKRTVAFMAGLALTGGAAMAGAQEQSTQEEWDTDSSIVTQDEREDRTGTETDTQGQYETQSTDPYETQTQTSDPYETETTDPYSSQSQTETSTQSQTETGSSTTMENPDLSQMSSEELQGKSIVSSNGEEIGTIEKVGYSEQHQDRVAAVNVGGFLGAGEKTIAIPLSDLSMGADANVTTTMDRQTIEQQEEIDPATLSEDPATTDPMQQQ